MLISSAQFDVIVNVVNSALIDEKVAMMVVRGNNIMATFSSIRALFTTFTITSNWSELMSTP